MRKRTIKKCECGYELTEKTKRGPSKSVEGKTTCPDCGGQASHFMYVDKENIDDERINQVVTRVKDKFNRNASTGATSTPNPLYEKGNKHNG